MKFEWTELQLNLLREIKIPFDVCTDLTDEQIGELDDFVADFMIANYINENDDLFGDGLLCLQILNIINSDVSTH